MKGLSGRRWILLSEIIKPEEDKILSLGSVVAQILANRGLDESALDLKLKNLSLPYHIPNLSQAVERIKEAILRKEKIILFGDYDVDGITGTALLYKFLKTAGATVIPIIPSRQSGYGLNKKLVDKFSKYADLLITIDNGTTAVEEIRAFKKDSIVIDHHNIGEEIPPTILVNPKLIEDLPTEFKELSSVSLVFYLTAVLSKELNMSYDPRMDIYLPAIGTLADFMPLNALNRIIVSYGIRCLEYIQKGLIVSHGIKALMETAGINGSITSRDISFSIVPRLNAPGRVSRPSIALKLFLAENREKAEAFAKKIEEINQKRKLIAQKAYDIALKQALLQGDRKFIVVVLDSWAGGVAGIVAGRLASLLQKPTAVFALGDYAVGSVRSANGINIYQALSRLSHLFLRWGGHAYAMGLTIEKEKIPIFKEMVEEVFTDVQTLPTLEIDMPLQPECITTSLIEDLRKLEPFGEGFPAPIFVCDAKLLPVYFDENKLELRSDKYNLFLCWDRDLNRKILKRGRIEGKVAYQIDLRNPRRLILLDVEDSE
ncbi:single-stranded-DNA-specific exonuclease RecJ [Thermocrinis sp.]